MKKLIYVLLASIFLLTACGGSNVEPDYTTTEFETELNNGEDLTGKTVLVEIDELVPDSAFGYNLQAGEHLNFVSSKNPGVKAGEEVLVEVTEVESMLGSYIIKYKKK